jgi:uncharacterized membrane protein
MLCLELDKAGWGESLNRKFKWLTLKDPETARTIVATSAASIISLTVFSFSMVMIVMSQAASQMSNRMLDNIVGDRVQKSVLGSYVGTIVFSLFLLTNIGKSKGDTTVPSFTVYVLIFFTIFDLLLFVYFLHYITQSFRYEQLIQRIHKRTIASLPVGNESATASLQRDSKNYHEIFSKESGYYQGFDLKRLVEMAERNNLVIQFLHPPGTYVLKGTPFLKIAGKVDEEELDKMLLDIDFYYGQEIDKNAYYGFLHLTEVAVKALSPGINDPGTAVLSINALTDLFASIKNNPEEREIKGSKGQVLIITKEISFEELFECTVLPIWDYGKKDRKVQIGLIKLLEQLKFVDTNKNHLKLFNHLLKEVEAEQLNKS